MTGFEADLTHFNEYRDTRTIDPNLFYNPATGYNLNPAAVDGVPNRPNPAYTQIAYFVSTGRRDQTQISTALNRRFKNNFQSGVTYTYMFSMHDDGNIGYTAPGQNNQFDYLDGEYATSTDFQRTRCAPGRSTGCRGGSRRACRTSTDRARDSPAAIAARRLRQARHQPAEPDRRRRRRPTRSSFRRRRRWPTAT